MPYYGIIQSYLARDGTPLAFSKLCRDSKSQFAIVGTPYFFYLLLALKSLRARPGIKSMPPAARYNLPFKISCLMSSSWNRFELFRKGIQRKNDLLQEIGLGLGLGLGLISF